MSTIVDLRKFRDRGRAVPTLVLVDLHHELFDLFEVGVSGPTRALDNCLTLLQARQDLGVSGGVHAPDRRTAQPRCGPDLSALDQRLRAAEIGHGVRPLPSRPATRAPTSRKWRSISGGNFVVAGQVGELSCLSTAVDAFHRDQRPTFLTDALVTRGGRDLPAATMERGPWRISCPSMSIPTRPEGG